MVDNPVHNIARKAYLHDVKELADVNPAFPRGNDLANTIGIIVEFFRKKNVCTCIVTCQPLTVRMTQSYLDKFNPSVLTFGMHGFHVRKE